MEIDLISFKKDIDRHLRKRRKKKLLRSSNFKICVLCIFKMALKKSHKINQPIKKTESFLNLLSYLFFSEFISIPIRIKKLRQKEIFIPTSNLGRILFDMKWNKINLYFNEIIKYGLQIIPLISILFSTW